ncbi:MAG: hypothetical protein ACYCVD_04120 [Desulfitobacteriaceae bacterium]
MFLRKLTDEDIERIKKAKDAANKTTKEQRKKLMTEIKIYQRTAHVTKVNLLIKQLDELGVIIGHPVIIKVDDMSLCMNHDLLKKFERSLDKSDFWNPNIKIEGKTLFISYQKHPNRGTVELYELPLYQVELLTGLPTIDLKDIEFESLLA